MRILLFKTRHLGAFFFCLVLAVSSSAVYPAPAVAHGARMKAQTAPARSEVLAPSAGVMAFDGLVVRPVSFVGTILGTATFMVTLPFSALGGNVEEAGHRLVVEPAAFTFDRQLGEFPRNSSY